MFISVIMVTKILTCGTYDLFHLGHLNQLKQAKNLDLANNSLVVGVSSDFLNLKKKGRLPVVPLYQRVQIIRALKSVDTVFVEEEYDTDSKRRYAQLYGATVFTIGDDWMGRFDDLTGRENIKRVVYLPRTPNLSTSRTVEVIGSHISFDLYQIKPNLHSQHKILPHKVKIVADSIVDVAPFVSFFKDHNVYWSKELWNSSYFQDFNHSKVGSLYLDQEMDLIVSDRLLEEEPLHSQIVVQRKNGSYLLSLYRPDRQTSFEISMPSDCAFLIATQSRDIWFLNQRLDEQQISRKNILIKLKPESLRKFRARIVQWASLYNLIIITHQQEQGISVPRSTLNKIFWKTVENDTARFINILPNDYLIYEPNLYSHCDVFISDRFDYLPFTYIGEAYGYQLEASGQMESIQSPAEADLLIRTKQSNRKPLWNKQDDRFQEFSKIFDQL